MGISFEHLRLQPVAFLLGEKVIKLYGPDVEAYLHSQTTNNIKNLDENSFQLNSILDVTGKIISGFILLKKSISEFYIVVKEQYIQSTLERIEKYHIAEDFEVEIIDKPVSLICNQNEPEAFNGQYFFENDQIVFKEVTNYSTEYDVLKILTGIPELGKEAQPGELINNTRFDELAVDYKKGCYPGQETVSKINTRRGAAFKPVLIICEDEITIHDLKLTQAGKKIGEIKNSISLEGKTYICAALNRENRIEKLNLKFELADQCCEGIVHYYPYLKPDKHSLAVDLYDHAIELFQSGDNEGAKKYFKLAIDIDPKFEDAYESLGVLYGRLEDYPTAISLMEELKELNPKCMMALTNLSLYHMKVGNIETAEKYKSDATLLNFQLLGDEAKQKRAKAEIEEKRQADLSRREGMFKQVLEMDPEDAMANNGMGEIELDRKNYLAAIPYFEAAIKYNPKYSVAYLGLAKSLYQLQENSKLKDVLTKGIDIASKNGDLMPANEMQSMLIKLN